VARELERQWEAALLKKRKLDDQYDRFQAERPDRLSSDQRAAIMSLAFDIPALWKAASTGNADRQRVIRHLVNHVTVEVQGKSEFLDCTIHWKGGYQSHHEVARSVRSYTQLRDFDRLKDRVIELNKQGCTATMVAAEQVRRATDVFLRSVRLPLRLRRREYQEESERIDYHQTRNAVASRSHWKTLLQRYKQLGIDPMRIKSIHPKDHETGSSRPKVALSS
jgi:hypothetical protein